MKMEQKQFPLLLQKQKALLTPRKKCKWNQRLPHASACLPPASCCASAARPNATQQRQTEDEDGAETVPPPVTETNNSSNSEKGMEVNHFNTSINLTQALRLSGHYSPTSEFATTMNINNNPVLLILAYDLFVIACIQKDEVLSVSVLLPTSQLFQSA